MKKRIVPNYVVGCTGKIRYPTREAAWNVASTIVPRNSDRCRVYRCKECKQFHVTSQSKKTRRKS